MFLLSCGFQGTTITGNHCHFPVIDGEMVRGGAQEIYFCEFDGPAHRTINVIIQEEK